MSNKTKKILFRADAAPHIGTGDLMSLIHLSNYLDSSWEVFFVIKNYRAGVELAKKYSITNVKILDEKININDEVELLNKFIKENSIDIIFFEITERKLTDYKNISKNIKKVCVSFDGEILDDMDLVIDWDTESYRYFEPKKHPKTKFLLGYEYVILPKEFYDEKAQHRSVNTPIKNILVAMGGADEYDFTSKIVSSLEKLDLNITVVVGSGYQNIEKLKKLSYSRLLVNIPNMLEEYLKCDVAIGAGGLTVSELVALKISSCIVATYEHQIHRCKTFEENGYINYLGYRDINKNKLYSFLKEPSLKLDSVKFRTEEIIKELENV